VGKYSCSVVQLSVARFHGSSYDAIPSAVSKDLLSSVGWFSYPAISLVRRAKNKTLIKRPYSAIRIGPYSCVFEKNNIESTTFNMKIFQMKFREILVQTNRRQQV
jgi:hypothetical protein